MVCIGIDPYPNEGEKERKKKQSNPLIEYPDLHVFVDRSNRRSGRRFTLLLTLQATWAPTCLKKCQGHILRVINSSHLWVTCAKSYCLDVMWKAWGVTRSSETLTWDTHILNTDRSPSWVWQCLEMDGNGLHHFWHGRVRQSGQRKILPEFTQGVPRSTHGPCWSRWGILMSCGFNSNYLLVSSLYKPI